MVRKLLGNIKGPKGDTGLKGDPGAKGDKGDTGDRGVSGIQGNTGLQGIKGEPGIDVHSVKMNTQLFDKHDVLTGYYVGSQSGDLVESGGFSASNYIPVIPNSKLMSLPTIGQSHFYDKDYNPISGVSSVDSNPITVPPNARYFRTSTFGSGIDEKMIYLGTDNLEYQEYYNPELQNVLFSTAKVDFTSDGFPSITTKYDKDSNITYTFGELGVNKIHHLKRIKTNYFDHNITSDYISPYRIRAVNNPIADNPVFVTGGNHGTDGGLGHPTGDPVSIETFINNKKVTGGVHHTNEPIVVKVVNDVCGYNTVNRSTGVKRNILREHITYTFYQNVYTVSIEMVALEDLEFYGHRGLSIQKQTNTVRFIPQRDIISTVQTATDYKSTAEGSEAQRLIAESNTGDMVVMFLDDRNGLGNFELNHNDPRWFTSNTKVYCNTIEQNSFERLNSGQSFILSGGYYYGKNIGDDIGLGRAYKIVLDGKMVYCVDDFYMRDGHILVEPEHENSKITVLENVNVTSVGGFTTSKGLKYTVRSTSSLAFSVD